MSVRFEYVPTARPQRLQVAALDRTVGDWRIGRIIELYQALQERIPFAFEEMTEPKFKILADNSVRVYIEIRHELKPEEAHPRLESHGIAKAARDNIR